MTMASEVVRMRGGDLRHVGKIQARSQSQDSFGGQVLAWTTQSVEPMQIVPISGRELLAAQAVHNPMTHQVVMRYRAGITPNMRVLFEGRAFNVVAVRNEDERNKMLTLECVEGMAEG